MARAPLPGGALNVHPRRRAALFVLVTIGVVLWPMWGGAVVGSPTVDGYGTQWFFWFAGEILAGRQSVEWTDLFFYPWGKDMYAHTGGNLVDAWSAWPLRLVFGPVRGYNLWLAVVLASNAWAGARLAGALGATRVWPAALALVLNPYVLVEIDLGRPTQAWLAPMALAVAALVDMRRARDGIATGFLIALTGLAYWYYGLLIGVVAVLIGAERAVRERLWLPTLVAAAVACAVVAPFAGPMFGKLAAGAVPGLLALDGEGVIAPLALRTVEGDSQGLFVAAPLLAQAGALNDEGGLQFSPGMGVFGYVHLGVALAGAGLVLRGRVWVAIAIAAALFVASGPALIGPWGMVPNTPWITLTEHVDLLRRWWWPARALALVHILAAPLLAVLLDRLGGWRALAAGSFALALAVVPLRSDDLVPLPGWLPEVPPALVCLAAAPRGGVIDLPLLVDQKNLWWQTVHHQPLLGGMLLKKPAFAPKEYAALRAEDPLLVPLLAIGDKQYTREIVTATEAERARLVAQGYRYVLARIDAFRRPRTDARGATTWVSEWTRPRRQLVALLGEPAWEDRALAVWTIGGEALRCAP